MNLNSILFVLISGVIMVGCQTWTGSSVAEKRTTAAVDSFQCPVNAKYPPLFTVLENNQQRLVVELGPFGQFFDLSGDQYRYKVTYRGSKENKQDQEQIVLQGEGRGDRQRVQLPVTKTGVYYFTIFVDEKKPVWKQKVFSIAASEHVLTDAEKKSLAEQYAPIVNYNENELYFPVSLEYMTNQVDVDPQLKNEPFRLTNKKIASTFSFFSSTPSLDIQFPFSELPSILPYYGHAESVLKSGLSSSSDTRLKSRYGEKYATVYYSVFENPKYKEIYINYHFFYSYDPKNGTQDNEAIAAHIFDRESMTVVLRSTTKQPLMVFYGAHLANQKMGHLSAQGDILQQWETGRVFVNWPLVNKQNGRPVPAIALGSHAVYPKKGNYAVFLNDRIKVLTEPAGGDRWLYPDFDSSFQKKSNTWSYQLKDLQLDHVTSDCHQTNSLLAFSGSTVDVLGPTNATFPPFTDREEDYQSYADPNAPMFEMDRE